VAGHCDRLVVVHERRCDRRHLVELRVDSAVGGEGHSPGMSSVRLSPQRTTSTPVPAICLRARPPAVHVAADRAAGNAPTPRTDQRALPAGQISRPTTGTGRTAAHATARDSASPGFLPRNPPWSTRSRSASRPRQRKRATGALTGRIFMRVFPRVRIPTLMVNLFKAA
jgi:hypothetical protein